MAEALLTRALRDIEKVTVESAGLGALVGHAADESALALMDEQGIDISAHRARQIHPDMVTNADLVLVMEAGHRRVIDDADPTARGKVYRLGEWQEQDIADPYRKGRSAFIAALRDIEQGVASWAKRLKA